MAFPITRDYVAITCDYGDHLLVLQSLIMKDVIKNIVGKTIHGVVVTRAHNANRMHVYLAFSDNTYFELWSPAAIAGGRQFESGGMAEIRKYARDQSIVQEAEDAGS